MVLTVDKARLVCLDPVTKNWDSYSQTWLKSSDVRQSIPVVYTTTRWLTHSSENSNKHGFLGSRSLLGAESATNNEAVTIMYFKSSEHVQAFATGPLHRKAYGWWAKNASQYPHIGIFHELYHVPKQNWETLYAHLKPTLAGATQHTVQRYGADEKLVDMDHQSPLVLSKGVLKTSLGRMGRLPGTFVRSDLEVKGGESV
jgi:heme-degrading monooxygenase HmoA